MRLVSSWRLLPIDIPADPLLSGLDNSNLRCDQNSREFWIFAESTEFLEVKLCGLLCLIPWYDPEN